MLLSVLVGCDAIYSVQSSRTDNSYTWNYSCGCRVAMYALYTCTWWLFVTLMYVRGYTCCILIKYLPSQCFLQWYCFWWCHWYSVFGNPTDFSVFWQFSGCVIVEVLNWQLSVVYSILCNVITCSTQNMHMNASTVMGNVHSVQLFSTTSPEVMVFINPSNASWNCFLCVVILQFVFICITMCRLSAHIWSYICQCVWITTWVLCPSQ